MCEVQNQMERILYWYTDVAHVYADFSPQTVGWCMFEVNFRIYYHLIECLMNCISKKQFKNIVPWDHIEQCK